MNSCFILNFNDTEAFLLAGSGKQKDPFSDENKDGTDDPTNSKARMRKNYVLVQAYTRTCIYIYV